MMTTVQQMSSFEFQMVCAVRLILASCCGLCIGIERTNRLKDAGIRTHLIVCMGAALMMLVSKYGFLTSRPSPSFSRRMSPAWRPAWSRALAFSVRASSLSATAVLPA